MPQEPARIALKPAQARSSLSREGKLAGVAYDVDLTVRLRAADRRRYVRRQNSLGANSCVTEKSVRALSRRWTLQCLWKRLRWRLIKSRRYGYQSLPQPPVWNLGTSELFRQIANDRGCLDHPSLESRLDLHVDRQPLLMRRDLCGILSRSAGRGDGPERPLPAPRGEVTDRKRIREIPISYRMSPALSRSPTAHCREPCASFIRAAPPARHQFLGARTRLVSGVELSFAPGLGAYERRIRRTSPAGSAGRRSLGRSDRGRPSDTRGGGRSPW